MFFSRVLIVTQYETKGLVAAKHVLLRSGKFKTA